MSPTRSGAGHTAVIATVAGLVFAGFIVLTPRLTTSNSDSPGVTVAESASTSGVGLPEISDAAAAGPAVPLDIDVEIIQPEPEPEPQTETSSLPPTTPPSTMPIDPAAAGFVSMSVDAKGPRDAFATAIAVEGDEIEWRFHVENVSADEVWGVYVFLELHGPTRCEKRNLKPGEATDCWIATNAVEGTHTASAWVTAWTLDHIVADQLGYTFTVTL